MGSQDSLMCVGSEGYPTLSDPKEELYCSTCEHHNWNTDQWKNHQELQDVLWEESKQVEAV